MSTSTRPGATPGRGDEVARGPWTRARAIGLSSVVVASLATVVTGSPASAAPAPAVPTFVDGMAQPVFDRAIAIHEELWVESTVDSDGDGKLDRIHVDVSRPAETETDGLKVPVVYAVSPYYAGGSAVTNWGVDHELGFPPLTKEPWNTGWTARNTSPTISTAEEANWLPRGFAVVHAESIGTGLSDGCPTIGDPNETAGARAAIDWLNGNAKGYATKDGTEEVAADWTTGKVGMIGTSYNGTLPNAVATTGVEGLEAAVPFAAISNWYDYYRANGAVIAPGGYQGEDLDVLADYVYSRADRAICQPIIEEMRQKQDRATGDYSAYWDARNYMNDEDNITAAMFLVHGLNDWNVKIKNSIQLWEAMKDNGNPRLLSLHQGGHSQTAPFDLLNKWFSRFLYDVPNGIEDGPKAYVVPQGGSSNSPTAYADWPVPGAESVELGLTAATGSALAGGLGFTASAAGTEQTIVDDASKTLATLANTKAATAGDHVANRLLYKTPVLTSDVRMSGTATVDLRVAFNKPAANLSVAVVDYNPAATGASDAARVVTRGWVDPQNAGDLYGEGSPLVPGQEYTLRFDLQPHDWVFAAGRQIGFVVYSSDREFTIRPAAGTVLTVDTAASTVTLPIVNGVSSLAGSARGVNWDEDAIDSASALLDGYRADGKIPAHVYASLKDRLDRAAGAAAAGSEARTLAFLEQFVARANNQVKGDAEDLATRAALVAAAEQLIGEFTAAEGAENTPLATPTWPGNDWLNPRSAQ
jgi:X-Pro dipeptidyl-peptidase